MTEFKSEKAPSPSHRCPICGDTGLVRTSAPAAPPAPLGDRAPTTQDALQWGAWLLKCRLCECVEALSA